MIRNILLPAIIILVLITCTLFTNDVSIYFITLLMAFVITGIIRSNRPRVMKMTRWAKANPHKTQVFITVLQIVLIVLGLIAGYNLKKSGYELSGTSVFVFSTLLFTGFLSVPFLPKRSTIAIPAKVDKHRLIFMGVAISSFVLTVSTGNSIEERYPNSPITHSLQVIDQAIFPHNGTLYADQNDLASEIFSNKHHKNTTPGSSYSLAAFASLETGTVGPYPSSMDEMREKPKMEKKEKRLEKKKARMIKRLEVVRMAFAAGITVGAVLLIVLLTITLCAGICLVVGGIGAGNIALAPLGAAIAAGSVLGIIKIIRKSKSKNKS